MSNAAAIHRSPTADFRLGVLMVAGSAVTWSFGGTIARFIHVADSWTVVFWRALFASTFLLLFMLWRDGPKATASMVRNMGLPGLGVAFCFGVASSCFVVALQYTTVANIQTMRLNVSAANSRIRDVDVAEESSMMSRQQVMMQAGTSILAQANQSPQYVLQLLKG